jgi:hypothetical protein
MRDKSHSEQIERWAKYIKESKGDWKEKLDKFLNAQIITSRRALSKISMMPDGHKKIRIIKGLEK